MEKAERRGVGSMQSRGLREMSHSNGPIQVEMPPP